MKSSTVRTYNKEVHHAEVAKVIFVLLYGEGDKHFRTVAAPHFDWVVSCVRDYDGRLGSANVCLPYIAINPVLNSGSYFAFQRLGINLARMHRMNALLNTGVCGFDILDMDSLANLYHAIKLDLVDIGVL